MGGNFACAHRARPNGSAGSKPGEPDTLCATTDYDTARGNCSVSAGFKPIEGGHFPDAPLKFRPFTTSFTTIKIGHSGPGGKSYSLITKRRFAPTPNLALRRPAGAVHRSACGLSGRTPIGLSHTRLAQAWPLYRPVMARKIIHEVLRCIEGLDGGRCGKHLVAVVSLTRSFRVRWVFWRTDTDGRIFHIFGRGPD